MNVVSQFFGHIQEHVLLDQQLADVPDHSGSRFGIKLRIFSGIPEDLVLKTLSAE